MLANTLMIAIATKLMVLITALLFSQPRSADGDGPGWPAPGSEDTELGVFMGPEVSHGATKVYAGVQA